MEVLIVLIGVPVIAGIGIAIYEWRKKTMVLQHDFNLAGPQTEADRERERATQMIHEEH